MTHPVTQADRDAAADYCQSGSDDGHTFNAMRTGECDNHPLVQAFASHRLAAEAGIVAWLLAGHQEWREKASKYRAAGNEGPYLGQPSYHNTAAAIARREHAGEG